MPFFKRILKPPEPDEAATPNEPAVARVERRSGVRYAINPSCPLQAVLSFIGRDETGARMSTSPVGWDWKGRLLDVSELGARMQLGSWARAASGDSCELKLSLEGFELTVPCHVSNIREQGEGFCYGLKHDITNETTLAGYQQLLDIVALGARLKPQSRKAEPDQSGHYLLEQYASDRQSRLKIWRLKSDRTVVAFEFLLKDCLVRMQEGHRMEYWIGSDAGEAQRVSGGKTAEVHRLFHWVVPNLSSVVPEDVRKFLQKHAA